MNVRSSRWPGARARSAAAVVGTVLASTLVVVAVAATMPSPRVHHRLTYSCTIESAVGSALSRHQQTSACVTSPAPGTEARSWPQPTAGERLHDLAGRLAATPADRQTGRYTYQHLRRWILDTTGQPAPRPNTAAVFALDLHWWAAADGSGVDVATAVGPDYQLAAANPQYHSTNAEFAARPAVRTIHPTGHMGSPIPAPLATEPATLAHQLDVDLMPDRPDDTLRAVDMLYTTHHVTRPVRVAALRVLADLDGLTYHPKAIDRLGRTGVAVTIENRNIRHRLILDPTTGDLLAAEQQLTGPHDYLPVPAGLITYYALFLDRGRRGAPDQTAPDKTLPGTPTGELRRFDGRGRWPT